MLGIPSFPLLLPAFAAVGFIVAAASAYSLLKGKNIQEKEKVRLVMTLLGSFVFFLFGTIFSISYIWQAYDFWSIDISKVEGFQVFKSTDEYSETNSQPIIFNNAQLAQEALKSLKKCGYTQPDHEHFEDGYKLQILFTDESLGKDNYISVYKRTNRNPNKSAVMPHFYKNRNLNLGEYNCPAFQDWVMKNIDPLFQDKENQSK